MNRYTDMLFCSCDLDLDLMTLIYQLYVDIPKIYLHIKNEHQTMQNFEPKENMQTPWLWCKDFIIRTGLEDSEDLPTYHKWTYQVQAFKS